MGPEREGSYASHSLLDGSGQTLCISQMRNEADQLPPQGKIPLKTC